MVRFVHSADWQLGMTRHFLEGEAQARFAQARFDAIRSIGHVAERERAEFVVVSGDVFESNQLDRRPVLRALAAMNEVPLPLYLLPGNHDPLDAASVFTSPAFRRNRPSHVHVLDGGIREVRPGVELVGAPWRSKRPLLDLVAEACRGLETRPGTVRIGVAHGAVDVLSPDQANPALIALAGVEQALDRGALHYLALGDRHSVTSVGGTGRVWYAGAPEPTDYDEEQPAHVLVVDLDEASCNVRPVKVGTWRYVHQDFEVSDETLDDLDAWLGAQPDKERTIAKLSVVGTLTLRGHARFEDLLQGHRDVYAAIELSERQTDLAVVPDDGDLGDLGLTGFAGEAARTLQELAHVQGEAGAEARAALGLLHRLAKGMAR